MILQHNNIMATLWPILEALFFPFAVFFTFLITLSAINKSLGVRRAYVKLLLRIFEYGRVSIETAAKDRQQQIEQKRNNAAAAAAAAAANTTTSVNCLEKNKVEGAQQCSYATNNTTTATASIASTLSTGTAAAAEAATTNGNSLISRDSVLLPTAENPKISSASTSSLTSLSSSTRQGDQNVDVKDGKRSDESINFNFEKCLDYIKAGVEAIIEDEVTSRFEAEQLRSWNLLTRTNRQYEFINWKITLIWMIGFTVRYFILMPLRVFVCFVGVYIAIALNSVTALIPFAFIRRPCAHLTYKVTFRLLNRSLSTVVNFHNTEYKPKTVGFCVANHTSPLDVVILSTDCVFSLVVWLTVCTALVGYLPEGERKRDMVKYVLSHCFAVLSSAISAVINYHNEENRPKSGICVANHTSPIDVLVLMCDTTYSLIGQRHGGFLGLLQRALARASPHIWFERGEAKDRHAVAERLKQHVSDPTNPPILIFPEGTCINNTSVMQFKKGSFEVGGVIYPVAIKYDARFGDAFWNSSKYSMMQYLYMMMTSWAIVCDVWYLPPMYREENESAIDFANRVKSVIAKQGGLVDLVWDGQLKRMKPKKEWKEMQQIAFTKRLKSD